MYDLCLAFLLGMLAGWLLWAPKHPRQIPRKSLPPEQAIDHWLAQVRAEDAWEHQRPLRYWEDPQD